MVTVPGPKKVLVVDDDPELRATVGEALTRRGFEVIEAENGLEALLHFKRSKPAAVVLDLRMPRLGGLDALKRMIAFDPAVRAIVVTEELDAALRQQAIGLGAAEVLAKPLVLPDLLTALGVSPEPPGATAEPTSARPEEPQRSRPPAPPRGRVVVVDDNPEIRATLEEFLSLAGYETRSAADGTAAIRDIVQAPPDVVLLDIEMPGLRGVDALPAILAVAPTVKVIMVSGTTDLNLAKRALAYGAFDYVVKPIDFTYLTQSLESALAMRAIEAPEA